MAIFLIFLYKIVPIYVINFTLFDTTKNTLYLHMQVFQYGAGSAGFFYTAALGKCMKENKIMLLSLVNIIKGKLFFRLWSKL